MDGFELPARLKNPDPPIRLLFVTSKIALENQAHWSEPDARTALAPHHLLVLSEDGVVPSASDAAQTVRDEIELRSPIAGVVIIGGYDTVPARAYNSVPDEIRVLMSGSSTNLDDGDYDEDDYQVWNDDHYVTLGTDKHPTLPVSRIPCWNDVRSSPITCQEFVKQSLMADLYEPDEHDSVVTVRAGEFGFSGWVYDHYLNRSTKKLWLSAVAEAGATETRSFTELQTNYLYLVLHGFYSDCRFFVGTPQTKIAISINELTRPRGVDGRIADTIFVSSCWGALLSKSTAFMWTVNPVLGPILTPKTSLAMRFLSLGINAYIGFTGSHHSSKNEAVAHHAFLAEPLHHLFWENRLLNKLAPASALHAARREYLRRAPYPLPGDFPNYEPMDDIPWDPDDTGAWSPDDDPFARALELKTFWSVTCLGLGW